MAVEYKIIGGDGHEYGPASLEEIRQWSEDARLAPGTPVWRSDERRWLPAGSREELKWDLPQPTAPPPVVPSETPVLRPAGFLVRLAAYLFDWLFLVCLVTFVTLPWAEELGRLQEAAQAQVKSASPDFKILGHYLLVMGAIEIPLTFAYFVLFNALRGATPGKRIFGLRVVRLDGSPISWRQALGRQGADWISKLTFGLGYLMILLSPEKRALHDHMARTQVVFLR